MTNAYAKAEIKADRGRLTEDEIDRMIFEAERYRAQDEALALKVSLRNACEEAIYKALAAAKDKADAEVPFYYFLFCFAFSLFLFFSFSYTHPFFDTRCSTSMILLK